MSQNTVTPKIAFPFQMEGSEVACVEQDSIEEIADCVEVVVRTRPGQRYDDPEFGLRDPTFTMRDAQAHDLEAIKAEIIEWEPRAHSVLEHDQQADLTFDRISVYVLGEEPTP